MAEAKFVGWENYFGEYGLFANPNHTDGFWQSDWGTSITNTLKFSVVSVTLETLAGLGVAMGNATDDIRKIADVTTDDNNHDGVAAAIEKYVL